MIFVDRRRFVILLGLGWFLMAAPAGADGPGDSARLRRLLVSELLSGASVVEKTGADRATVETVGREKKRAVPEVGRAVVAVPTWPVLGLCLLLGALLWWMKRGRQHEGVNASIRRLATVPLGGRRSLALVEVMGERLLLGLADKQVNLLARMEAGETSQRDPGQLTPTTGVDEEFFDRELARLVERSAARDQSEVPTAAVTARERRELDRKLSGLWSG